MVAIEHSGELLAPSRWNLRQRTVGLIAGIGFAILLACAAFLVRGGDMNAARFAANTVLVASSFLFVIYYVAAPIARLIPGAAARALGQERFALAYGFVGMTGVYTLCLLTPDWLMQARLPLPTLTYAALTAFMAIAFLLSAGSKRTAAMPTLRTVQSLTSGYFWLTFAFTDMDHMIGPHRPDGNFYGPSLMLLAIALIVRFADAFVQHFNAGMSERVT